MTAKISEILDLQHKEIMYALEQMKEAEKLIWKEAMAKASFQTEYRFEKFDWSRAPSS